MFSAVWDIGEESLRGKIESKASSLFNARFGRTQLEVVRISRPLYRGDEQSGPEVKIQDVSDISELKELKQRAEDVVQLYLIRQPRSWTKLNISRDLFEAFTKLQTTFSQLWKVLFAFGVKTTENEFEFPSFGHRHHPSMKLGDNLSDEYEFAYVARRVERHNRQGEASPWSIRQTGVYHKLKIESVPKSIFLVISPSNLFDRLLPFSSNKSDNVIGEEATNPWNYHKLFLLESLNNWSDYLAWIETQLRDLFNRVILTEVEPEKDSAASILQFGMGFADRQKLQQLEDCTIDLRVIFPVILDNLCGIRNACQQCCVKHCKKLSINCDCAYIIEELDVGIMEMNTLINRNICLRERAISISKLLADLLNYEDTLALKHLAQDTHLESKSMHYLTKRSTKDAAAVKALTVISLIYLPTTIVANFFSTQFIQTNENGHMRISTNVWLLAAVAVPLTAVTIALWILWIRCSNFADPALPLYHPQLGLSPTKHSVGHSSSIADNLTGAEGTWKLSSRSTLRESIRSRSFSLWNTGMKLTGLCPKR